MPTRSAGSADQARPERSGGTPTGQRARSDHGPPAGGTGTRQEAGAQSATGAGLPLAGGAPAGTGEARAQRAGGRPEDRTGTGPDRAGGRAHDPPPGPQGEPPRASPHPTPQHTATGRRGRWLWMGWHGCSTDTSEGISTPRQSAMLLRQGRLWLVRLSQYASGALLTPLSCAAVTVAVSAAWTLLLPAAGSGGLPWHRASLPPCPSD